MDWATVDLILTLLFAAIITINLLLLGRRLQHLERRKIIDLEKAHHDVELLDKLRDLQTTESKNGPSDEKAFQYFMYLAGEKNLNLDPKYEDQKMILRREGLLQAVIKFLHLERPEALLNEKQELGAAVAPPDYTADVLDEIQSKEVGHNIDSNGYCCYYVSPTERISMDVKDEEEVSQIDSWGLHKCSGCSKQMAGDDFKKVCAPWGCRRHWCDSCMDSIQKSLSPLGGIAQAYCICGSILACHGFDSLSCKDAACFEKICKKASKIHL